MFHLVCYILNLVLVINLAKQYKKKKTGCILQGTEDDVVNWLHGSGLWKMARDPYEPLWIKGGGHCNLELYPDYIRHLCRFIQEMENLTTEIRLKKIRQTLRLHRRSSSLFRNFTNRCCKIKCKPSNCLDCSKPNCIMCCRWPKCSACWPKCLERRPKCIEYITPSCMKCSCLCTTFSCSCRKCSCLCRRCSCCL